MSEGEVGTDPDSKPLPGDETGRPIPRRVVHSISATGPGLTGPSLRGGICWSVGIILFLNCSFLLSGTEIYRVLETPVESGLPDIPMICLLSSVFRTKVDEYRSLNTTCESRQMSNNNSSGYESPVDEDTEIGVATEEYLADRDDVSEETARTVRKDLKPFGAWCADNDVETLGELTKGHLQAYKRHRKEEVKKITLDNQQSTLRGFIKFCEDHDACSQGLASSVRSQRVSYQDRVRDEKVDVEKMDAIISSLHQMDYASRQHAECVAERWAGMRIGALIGLDVSDADYEQNVLSIRHREGTPLKNKEGGERDVTIPDHAMQVIRDYVETKRIDVTDENGREPLFTTRSGRPSTSTVRRDFYKVMRPCLYEGECPLGRDTGECIASTKNSQASKCPSVLYPHAWRSGSITDQLRRMPVEVVSERVDASPSTIRDHYDTRKHEELRRDRLDEVRRAFGQRSEPRPLLDSVTSVARRASDSDVHLVLVVLGLATVLLNVGTL